MRVLLPSLVCLVLPLCAGAQTTLTERRAYSLLLDGDGFRNEDFTALQIGLDLWRCGTRRGSRFASLQRARVTLQDWSLVLGFPEIPLAAIPEAAADAAVLADRTGWIDPQFPGTTYLIDGADRSYVIHHLLDDVVAVMVDDLPPASSLAEDCTGPGAEAADPAAPANDGGGPPATSDDGARDGDVAATDAKSQETGADQTAATGRDTRPPAPDGAPGNAATSALATDLRNDLICRGAILAPPPPAPVISDAALDWLAFRARCDASERLRKEIAAHLCAIGYPCAGPWDSPVAARMFLGKTWAEALWWLTAQANG